MALNQKYTWKDFLKEHPEYKEKKIKRTSKEAVKAFESAYKQHVKEYLKDRIVKIDKEKDRAEKRKKELVTTLKGVKINSKSVALKTKIGAMNAYLARLEKMKDRTKTLQKGA